MRVAKIKGLICLVAVLAVISTTVIIATDSEIEQSENQSKESTVIVTVGVVAILSVFMYGIKPAEKVKEIVEERKERNAREEREARGEREARKEREEREAREEREGDIGGEGKRGIFETGGEKEHLY